MLAEHAAELVAWLATFPDNWTTGDNGDVVRCPDRDLGFCDNAFAYPGQAFDFAHREACVPQCSKSLVALRFA